MSAINEQFLAVADVLAKRGVGLTIGVRRITTGWEMELEARDMDYLVGLQADWPLKELGFVVTDGFEMPSVESLFSSSVQGVPIQYTLTLRGQVVA